MNIKGARDIEYPASISASSWRPLLFVSLLDALEPSTKDYIAHALWGSPLDQLYRAGDVLDAYWRFY
jgi:hypothetical protein